MSELETTLRLMGPFYDWSPNELCHALGFRIDLRGHSNGLSDAWIIGARRERCVTHERACRLLARLAMCRRIDPHNRPALARRALRNGREQEL
jgi:hypothetical protein